MANVNVEKILYGLKPRNTPEEGNVQKKIVVDGYVPKASGISIVDRIKNTYSHDLSGRNSF